MARLNLSVLSTCWQILMLADSTNLRRRKRSLHKIDSVSLAITSNLAIMTNLATSSLVMINLAITTSLVMSSKEAQDLISRASNQDNLSKVSLNSRISHSKVNLSNLSKDNSKDNSRDSHVNKEDLMANTTVQETTTAKKDQRATRAAKVELTT